MRISEMCNERNRIKNTLRCIASIVLAVAMILEPVVPVFAEEAEKSDRSAAASVSLESLPDEETADPEDEDKAESNEEAQSAHKDQESEENETDKQDADNEAPSNEENKEEPSDKDEVRDALQHSKSKALQSSDDEDIEDPQEDSITVSVSIVNNTYPKGKGAPWDGTLIDTDVTVPSDYTMMQAIHKVCQDNSIPSVGTDGSYISMIGGLREFDGGGGSGWMGTLNDWFVNHGFDQMTIKEGDVIQVEYTCDLGEDLGSSFGLKDKRVKALTTSVGELSPDFDQDFDMYNLLVPEGTDEVSIFTTAVNRNYLVKSIVKGVEYERGAKIPVSDGTKITVKCGDPSWPSMNAYGQEDTVKPVTYRITVFEGAPSFLVDVTGVKCVPELDRESGIYSAGEKVTATLRYNKNKYRVIEDTVRAYVGGSSKYITLTKERDDIYSFTMPCNDVEVRAECETRDDYPLEVTGSLTDCTMTLDHTDGKYYRGENVSFTLKAPSGKRINDLSVKAEEKTGDSVELDHVSQDKYSFIMPGEPVVIYAESEEKTKNGLKGYTITTPYGNVTNTLTDASRTSICTLPERATEFGLSLDIDESEELTAVRVKDINGNIQTYTSHEMTEVSVGTKNTALLGKDVTATVLTKDSDGRTHTYTIRIKTQKNEYDRNNPDAEIIPVNAASSFSPILYKRTLMTSGVILYEADYPTILSGNTATQAYVNLRLCPTYEEVPGSLAIRCKYCVFDYEAGRGEYRTSVSNPIIVLPGDTMEIPIEVDFKLASGEYMTRRYLYRITNGKFARQKFKVLTSAGNPMTPTTFSIDGRSVKTSGLVFEDGCFTVDLAAGDHTAVSMGQTVDFTVEEGLERPYKTETVVIQTDTPEYKCKVSCSDKKAVYTIKEASAGIEYYVKASGDTFSLPPGSYVLKAYNEGSHRYSKTTFVITDGDVSVTAQAPYLTDPEYVVEELNMLEEIQAFDDGNGRLRIYLPDYQNGSIKVKPVVTVTDGLSVYTEKENDIWYYYVDRDVRDHVMMLKYEVYNDTGYTTSDTEKFYTDEMELYVPAYDGADPGGEDDPEVPAPDVRTLKLGYGIEDGDSITGMHNTTDEYNRTYSVGKTIPVIEEDGAITAEQAKKAGYKVKYTLRYAKNEGDAMVSVGYRIYMGGEFIAVSDSLPRMVFETSADYYSQANLLFSISPDISNFGGVGTNGWYEVTAWFEDTAGNKSESNTITVYQDAQPPSVTITPDHYDGYYREKPNAPVYTNMPVTIRINASDPGLGLHDEAYSYDKGATWTDRNTITLTEPGVIDAFDIWVRDKVGNIATYAAASFDADMYSNPTGTRYWFIQENNRLKWSDGGPWETDPGKRYFYVDTEYPSVGVISDFDRDTDTLSLEVRAVDQISGLETEAYSFDGGETWQSSNKHTVTLGEYSADNIRVRDRAGNITIYDPDYVWTKDSFSGRGPVIQSVKVSYGEGGGTGYDGRKWYQSAKVTINASPGDSEIAGYSFDGQKFTMSDSIEFDTGRAFAQGKIQVIDRAGNVTVYDNAVDVTNVDSVAPKINIYSFKGHAVAAVREIYLSIEATDTGSKGLKYAVTAIPVNEYWRGYPMPDLKLEWADSFDDDQFKVSNLAKKYDHDVLVTGARASWNQSGSAGPNNWGIRMWVKDAAGNISHYDTWTDGGYIDQDGPTITEVTTEYKRFNDSSGIVKVYVAATEPKYGAGLAPKAYSFDGGKTWQASNSTSIPIGDSIPAGQIKVRDAFGNISTYNKVVKTTLQNVITKINKLDPKTAKNKDYKEIIDLYNQLSDREKAKVYNWQKFLDMMGNRKDQDWDDDYGDIGEPDDGNDDSGDDGDDSHDDGPDGDHDNDNNEDSGSGDGDGNDSGNDHGSGDNDGTPSDGSGSGDGGGTPESSDISGGSDTDTVNVALSNASTSSAPDVKSKAGQSYREAEIDKVGGGGLLSEGIVKPWELMLLIIIVLGAYIYGAQKRYRRFREEV